MKKTLTLKEAWDLEKMCNCDVGRPTSASVLYEKIREDILKKNKNSSRTAIYIGKDHSILSFGQTGDYREGKFYPHGGDYDHIFTLEEKDLYFEVGAI